jgi:hypothetical protein
MSSRLAQPRGAHAEIEWVGGTVSMPGYVFEGEEPYRPDALFWMSGGAILGTAMLRPGEHLSVASDSLQRTIEQPVYGRPHRPTRVRVASAELAEALRAGHPDIEVVCAPTPELDYMFALMREKMAEDGLAEPSYLSAAIEPGAMGSFFAAAAALFRAEPWKVVPDAETLFSVTIEQLGIYNAALSVIGQMGQGLGLLLFTGLEDFEVYRDEARAAELGEEADDVPPHFVLNFERGARLPPKLHEEIAEHRWEVAAANAYPWPVAVDEDLVGRPPTAREVTMVEAIARALTHMLAEEEALQDAWDGDEPMSRTLRVTTHHGEIEVTLRTPYECAPASAPSEMDPQRDLLAGLAALDQDDDYIDPEAREPLEEALLRRFADAPESEELGEIYASSFVMDLAANHLGQTIATLDASDLHEVLFELFPRKASVDASDALGIVEELRAFYAFLKREYAFAQADSCLEVLGESAVAELEAALSDSRNFGMAKSIVMGGRDAGYDMETREGIEGWMRALQGKALPPSPSMSVAGTGAPQLKKAAKAKKDKRKAARKARKRNR